MASHGLGVEFVAPLPGVPGLGLAVEAGGLGATAGGLAGAAGSLAAGCVLGGAAEWASDA